MRLAVCAFILLVTALDFRFGSRGSLLSFAGLAAGVLLALTLIADRLRRADTGVKPMAPRDPTDLMRSEPGG